MTETSRQLNGLDVADLEAYIDAVRADATQADRNPVVVGRWVGGTRAEVVSTLGGPTVYMGGDDDASAMGMLLRALAACDIEVIVTRATKLGIELMDLAVEARAYFNVARYLGVAGPEGAGFQRVAYTVRMKTKHALTAEQEADLRSALAASPVGDTFERRVPVRFDLEVAPE